MTTATLASAIEEYLESIEARSEHLHSAASQALNLFCSYLAQHEELKPDTTPITRLRVGWAIGFLKYLQQNRAIETEHLYIRAIQDFYSFIQAAHDVPLDIQSLLTQVSAQRRPKEAGLPAIPTHEIETILAYSATSSPPTGDDIADRDILRFYRDRAFLNTLANTGLTVSEICELRRAALDRETKTLDYGDVSYPLNDSTFRFLNTYLQKRQILDASQSAIPLAELPLFARHDKRASDRILPISRWTAGNIVSDWAERALARTGEWKDTPNITPHSFRHYFVLKTLQATEDIEQAQTLARHTDRYTTRRYRQLLKEDSTDGQSDE